MPEKFKRANVKIDESLNTPSHLQQPEVRVNKQVADKYEKLKRNHFKKWTKRIKGMGFTYV